MRVAQPDEGEDRQAQASWSTTAVYPVITPASSSRRTRSVTALADIDTARASSAKLARPSACNAWRMRQSVASGENPVMDEG